MSLDSWIRAPLPITGEYCQQKMADLQEKMMDAKRAGRMPLTDCGFIYIMAFDNGLVKVGRSKDPLARMVQLQRRSMIPCRLVHVYATNNVRQEEYYIKDQMIKDVGNPAWGVEYWALADSELGELPWRDGSLWTQ